jgi:type II secretory pathway component PulC
MAFAALWLTGIATYFTVTRDDPPEPPKNAAAAPPKTEHAPTVRHVAAIDVIRLKHDGVDQATDGVRVRDAALAAKLGLQPDDTLLGISGHALHREFDVLDAILTLSMMSVTSMYVEIEHGNASDRDLAIWMIDGDLRTARVDPYAPSGPQPSIAPVSDPLVDTIRRHDDTHAEMPAETADKIAADPATYLHNARAIAWTSLGATNGIKLYALRTGSVLEAMLLKNGDLVHGVNGENVTTLDDFIDKMVKARRSDTWTLDVERRHVAMILTITVR